MSDIKMAHRMPGWYKDMFQGFQQTVEELFPDTADTAATLLLLLVLVVLLLLLVLLVRIYIEYMYIHALIHTHTHTHTHKSYLQVWYTYVVVLIAIITEVKGKFLITEQIEPCIANKLIRLIYVILLFFQYRFFYCSAFTYEVK